MDGASWKAIQQNQLGPSQKSMPASELAPNHRGMYSPSTRVTDARPRGVRSIQGADYYPNRKNEGLKYHFARIVLQHTIRPYKTDRQTLRLCWCWSDIVFALELFKLFFLGLVLLRKSRDNLEDLGKSDKASEIGDATYPISVGFQRRIDILEIGRAHV